jgi:hypothetical protein
MIDRQKAKYGQSIEWVEDKGNVGWEGTKDKK